MVGRGSFYRKESDVFLRSLWIIIMAALLGGCPDVLFKVVDDDDGSSDDDALTITDIDDIDEDADTEITVEVLIDDVLRSDRTTDVTLRIKCDSTSVAINPTRRRAKDSRAVWDDIELEEHRDADGDSVRCIVTAEAEVNGKDEVATTEFRIRGTAIVAKLTGSRLSFDNIDNDEFVTLVTHEDSSSVCRASLVVWPSSHDNPSVIINGEDRGVVGVRIDRGKADGLHLAGDARRCQLKVGNTLVEIPDHYDYSSDVIKGIEVYDRSRLRIFHNSDSSRTVDLVVYEDTNQKVNATRTLASNSTSTYLTISNAYFERNVDYTVWVRYYNRVVQFTGVDGTW